MPRKTHPEKNERGRRSTMESRTPRPKPKIDFTANFQSAKRVRALGGGIMNIALTS